MAREPASSPQASTLMCGSSPDPQGSLHAHSSHTAVYESTGGATSCSCMRLALKAGSETAYGQLTITAYNYGEGVLIDQSEVIHTPRTKNLIIERDVLQ
jgi:hypothetical protein